jgi:hypothetical protein
MKVCVVVIQGVNCYTQTSFACFCLCTSDLFFTFISFSSICRLLSKVIYFKCHCHFRVLRKKDEIQCNLQNKPSDFKELRNERHNTEVVSKPYFLLSSINYVTKGFRRDVSEICHLLGFYTAYKCSLLSAFQDNLSIPYSRVKKSQ